MRAKKYFSNYTARLETDSRGRTHRVMVYNGEGYRRELTPRRHIGYATFYLCGAVVSYILLTVSLMLPVASSMSGVIPGIGLFLLIPLFLFLAGGISFAAHKPVMTRWEWRESSKFIRIGSLVSAIIAAIRCLGILILSFTYYDPSEQGLELLSAALMAGIAAINAVAWRMEQKTKYQLLSVSEYQKEISRMERK